MLFTPSTARPCRWTPNTHCNWCWDKPAQYRPSADQEFATNAPLHLTRLLKGKIDAMPRFKGAAGDNASNRLNSAARPWWRRTPPSVKIGGQWARLPMACRGPSPISGAAADGNPDLCKADFFIELASLAWSETDPAADHQTRIDETVATLESIGRWLGHDGLQSIQSKRSSRSSFSRSFARSECGFPSGSSFPAGIQPLRTETN